MIASNQSFLKTFPETIAAAKRERGEKLGRKMSSGKYETVKKEKANPRKVLAEAGR